MSVVGVGRLLEKLETGRAGTDAQRVEEMLRLCEHAELQQVVGVLRTQREHARQPGLLIPQNCGR
ncbi:hypothetical protein [Streptomyces brasiliscabiei]|uniref:hypothetical protein n=1 Tax=Streptomyces brasiliscabiei TaxID=2736302 RepID=UPI0030141EDA